MKKICLIILLVFCLNLILSSQNTEETVDSLYNEIIRIHKNYKLSPEENLIKAEKLLSKVKKSGNKKIYINILVTLADINNFLGNYHTALDYLDKTVPLFKNSADKSRIYEIYSRLGLLNKNIGNYEKSLENYQKALKVLKSPNNNYSLKKSRTLNSIGNLYFEWSYLDKAKEYYEKSIQAGAKSRNKIQAYINLGNIFTSKENYKKAEENYLNALKLSEMYDIPYFIAKINNNISVMHFKKNEIEKALKFLLRAAEVNKKLNEDKSLLKNYINIFVYYDKLQDLEKRDKYIKLSKKILDKFSDPYLKIQLYQSLQLVYEEKSNFQKAYKYQKKAKAIEDSLFTVEKQKTINELETKYENAQKENQIKLLKTESKLQKAKIKKNEFQLRVLIIGSLGLLVFLFFLYRFYNHKKAANKKLRQMNDKLATSENNLRKINKTKDKFFSIIAHDLRNPIGAFVTMLEFLYHDISSEKNDSIKEDIESLRQNSKYIKDLLENLLNWSRSQTNRLQIQIDEFSPHEIVEQVENSLIAQTNAKNITIINKIDPDITVRSDYNMISTVFRNLISNAIKYSHKDSNIFLGNKIKKDKVIFSVEDCGVGIKKETIEKLFRIDENISTEGTNSEIGTGLGLILCKEFLEKLGGTIWVESEVGVGTTFYFSIPNSNKNS